MYDSESDKELLNLELRYFLCEDGHSPFNKTNAIRYMNYIVIELR